MSVPDRVLSMLFATSGALVVLIVAGAMLGRAGGLT